MTIATNDTLRQKEYSRSKNAPPLEIYFDDPRLHMSVPGRLFVRFAGYVAYLVLIAAAFTFLGSDLLWLTWSGVPLGLFLADRFLHRGEADRPLSAFPKEGVANLTHYLSPRAFLAIERAYDRHMVAGADLYLELMQELLHGGEVQEALARLDVPPKEFAARLHELLEESASAPGAAPAGGAAAQRAGAERATLDALVSEAFRVAYASRHRMIGAHDCFSALARQGNPRADRLFNMFSVDPGDLERAALFGMLAKEFRRLRGRPRALSAAVPGALYGMRHRIMNRAWTSRPTPALDRVSADLTDLARRGLAGFMIGHEREYEHLLAALARPAGAGQAAGGNALLVGDPTSGKETIVAHLAFALAKDRVPKELFDKRLVRLSIAELAAAAGGGSGDAGGGAAGGSAGGGAWDGGRNGAGSRGGPEELIKKITDEIALAGNVILYIPEFHELASGGSGAYLSLADAFLAAIRNNVFPVIGATFPREYKQYLEPRTDVTGMFETIHVEEISPEDAERILAHEAVILEASANVRVSFAAVKKAVDVGRKYVRDRLLPASALELLREGVRMAETKGESWLTPQHIVEAAEAKTNVPIHEATRAETAGLLHLEEIIHRTYVNQDEAVRAVSDALREYRSGLARTGGPIASFLFAGPTGVGKTELAKQIAQIQFGSEGAMMRFDMSEYQEASSIARFIGSADGSLRGALTEAVRERPYAVVLLDEFEKAHPDILNLFLSVLDEGRLTDTLERVIDFKNTVIVATSNAHSEYVLGAAERGETMDVIADTLKQRITSVFRPELVNRFSKIIVFKNLGRAEVRRIAELQLHAFGAQLGRQGIGFAVTPEAALRISELGYDPKFGARPLRQAIEEHIRAPLAKKLLAKEVRSGGAVTVAVENGAIVLR